MTKLKSRSVRPVGRNAAAKSVNPNKSKKNKPKKKSNLGPLTFAYSMIAASLMAMPGVAVLILMGMAPTWVTILADRDPLRPLRVQTIAAFNAIGVLPFAIALWEERNSIDALLNVITDVYAWLAMLGSAALGMTALYLGPVVAALFLQRLNDEKLNRLQKRKRALIDEWGPQIAQGLATSDDTDDSEKKDDGEAAKDAAAA